MSLAVLGFRCIQLKTGVSACAVLLFSIATGCDSPSPGMSSSAQGNDDARRHVLPSQLPGLDHIVEFAPGFINGSAPHNDKGFDSLQHLGVKTIICVDGAVPDAQRAAQRGMRYVHLPIGYGEPSEQEIAEIARAIRDLRHPLYVHCFHGQHRSPAALGAGLVALKQLTPDKATALMHRCGTSPKYPGLFAGVVRANMIARDAIDQAPDTFSAAATVDDFIGLMAQITRHRDHIDLIQAAGWQAPPDHPDLNCEHEARLLDEHFKACVQTEYAKHAPDDLRKRLAESSALATQLAELITRPDAPLLDAVWGDLRNRCTTCHDQYR